MIVHDAASAFVAIINTAVLWVEALTAAAGFVLSVALFAVGPVVAPAVKAAARRLSGPSWACGRVRARIHARRCVRGSQGRLRPSRVREPLHAAAVNTPPA